MVILSFASFPPNSAKEIGKLFLKLSPLPDYITTTGPFLYGTIEGGIKALTLYELVDQSKMSEALIRITDRLIPSFDVPGYTYDVRTANEAAEALKMVGLE